MEIKHDAFAYVYLRMFTWYSSYTIMYGGIETIESKTVKSVNKLKFTYERTRWFPYVYYFVHECVRVGICSCRNLFRLGYFTLIVLLNFSIF